jgi:hypothetical protein
MEDLSTVDYAVSYLRKWERRTDTNKAHASPLMVAFNHWYPAGRPVVELVSPLSKDAPANPEVVAELPEPGIDMNAPMPDSFPTLPEPTEPVATNEPMDIEMDPVAGGLPDVGYMEEGQDELDAINPADDDAVLY